MTNVPQTIPSLTCGDVINRIEWSIQRYLDAACFERRDDAERFCKTLRSHILDTRQGEVMTAPAITAGSDFDANIRRECERIRARYDPATGRLRHNMVRDEPSHFAQPVQRLPEQLFEEARRRVTAGKAASFQEALRGLCSELHVPVPQIPRAIADLLSEEPELLREEEEARAKLLDAQQRLESARASAVQIVSDRDRLVNENAQRKAELAALNAKRAWLVRRRERAEAMLQSKLSSAEAFNARIPDFAATVGTYSVALAAIDPLIEAKTQEANTAEKALADFLAANEKALAPV